MFETRTKLEQDIEQDFLQLFDKYTTDYVRVKKILKDRTVHIMQLVGPEICKAYGLGDYNKYTVETETIVMPESLRQEVLRVHLLSSLRK